MSISRRRVGILAGCLAALAPLSIDAYLPGMPTIATELHADPGAVQLSLMSFFVGLMGGQLFYGPLSDRYGRKPLIALGLCLFILASLGCVGATTPDALIVARLLEGAGGSIGMVIALAVVRDLYTGESAGRLMGMIVMVLGVAPIVAPLLGGAAIAYASWQVIFLVLAGFGALVLAGCLFGLPETRPSRLKSSDSLGQVLRTYGNLVRSPVFIPFAACLGLAQGGFFAFIAGSADLFITQLGMSPSGFAVLFAAAALCLMAASQGNVRLTRRFGFVAVTRGALVVYAVVAVGLALISGLHVIGVASAGGLVIVFVATLGAIIPSLNVLAMEEQGRAAGTAAALIGAFQFGGGAVASGLVGGLANGTPLPLSLIIAVCGLAALALATLAFPPADAPAAPQAARSAN